MSNEKLTLRKNHLVAISFIDTIIGLILMAFWFLSIEKIHWVILAPALVTFGGLLIISSREHFSTDTIGVFLVGLIKILLAVFIVRVSAHVKSSTETYEILTSVILGCSGIYNFILLLQIW